MSDIPTNWYEDFFHGLALDLWRKAVSPKQTKAEADFIVQMLRCSEGAHLLDVPCGNGRLSFEFARRGYRVTGLDISEEFIQEASALLTKDQPHASAGANDSVEFVLGDMRRIDDEAIYDGAYCFGNSFGYLEYADMNKFVDGVARALKPGARFVVETGMAAESSLPKFEKESTYQIADILTTIKEEYRAEESCIDSEYIFEHAGKTEIGMAKHWIYTVAEIRRMLERAGLAVKEIYGSHDRQPFVLGSDELFVIAKRVSEGRQ